ncbi:class I SAM-dependent methyltransferase [Methanobrevibacter oralis]|uniref:class I SAM-dependent methyltransferase n=1 Tax=Methanobrevibacter oralis TaxID=66851 RepID=UPI001C72AAAE|nr:class I SAM-dependent methyltransferase [Methanobrevibacter oralis]
MAKTQNGHRAHGFSSESFLDSHEFLDILNFKGDEVFMDAGCGDGHVAITVLNEYLNSGTVYAVDIYDASIEDMENYKLKNNIKNLINICADIPKGINGVEDSSIDIVLMVNVFHGFKASRQIDEAINEFSRITKTGGRVAVMDYKKWEVPKGPKFQMRSSPDELEEAFNHHNFKKVYLNEEIGEDIPEGKSHFLIIFEKVN